MERLFTIAFLAIVAVVMGFALMPYIFSSSNDTASAAFAETKGCTTAVAATSCSVTLTHPSFHAGITEMTVQETSPGSVDRTGTSTLNNSNRTTLTISGLVAATTYSFDLDYRYENPDVDGTAIDWLKFSPALIFGFILLIPGAAVVLAYLWITGRLRGGGA